MPVRSLTARATTSRTATGARHAPSTCGSRPRATPTGSGRSRTGRRRAGSPTASSTTSARTSSPRTASRVGLGLGPVPRPRLRARGAAPATDRAARLRPARPARSLPKRPAPDRLLADAAGRRNRSHVTARAPQQPEQLHRRVQRVRRHRVAARLAAARPGLLLTPSGYLPRADARGDAATAPPMELEGPLAATPGAGGGCGRRPGEREHRADRRSRRCSRASTTGSWPACRARCPPSSLPDRAARRRRRRAVRHLPRVPASARRPPGALPRLPAGRRTPRLSNEFAVVGYRAHSMVNGPLDTTEPDGTWPAATLAAFAAEAGSRCKRTTASCRSRSRWARGRQSRPAPDGRPRAGPRRASARSASTATTSRSTTRCAASCSSSR